jgi:hypothetical protein
MMTCQKAEPTKALDGIIAATIASQFIFEGEIFRRILGVMTTKITVQPCLLSFFG